MPDEVEGSRKLMSRSTGGGVGEEEEEEEGDDNDDSGIGRSRVHVDAHLHDSAFTAAALDVVQSRFH